MNLDMLQIEDSENEAQPFILLNKFKKNKSYLVFSSPMTALYYI